MSKTVLMYLLVCGLLLMGILVTDYVFLPYLEKIKVWPPGLFASGLIFTLDGLLIFGLVKMMSKLGSTPTKMSLFLLVCITISYPWALRTLDIILSVMLR